MNTKAFSIGGTFALCGLLLMPAAAAAQQDAARLDAIARDAAARFDEARAAADPQTRPTVPPAPPPATVDVSIDQATERALERNLDLAVERLNPRSFDFSIAALHSNYKPNLTSAFGMRSSTQFARSQTTGAGAAGTLSSETLTGNTGIAQNIPWFGGSYAVAFNNNRLVQSDAFALRNPTLNTTLNAQLVQPLLRGFRIDGTRQQLLVTKINQDMSEVAVRGTIVTTLATVRNAYWDLVYAIQAIDVAQRSLALATKLVEDNRSRVEVGTLAPIDIVQAQSEQALRQQALVQAESTRRTAELAFKRLVVNSTDDPWWTATINPIDRPQFAAEPLDLQSAVRRALENRTDLQQSRRQIEANDITIRSLRDQQLPALDLSASYGASGIGGPQFVRAPGSLGGAVLQTIPSGFTDALSTLTNLTAPQWNLTLNLSYPLGSSPADANIARARVQKEQAAAQVKQLELQIATEVTNAALQVDSSRARYQAANASRELQQRRLDAETSKFEVGMSTNFFVVQAQRDLSDAQNTELRALLDYRKALVDFQRVQEAPAVGRSSGGITGVSAGGAAQPNIRANASGGGGF
jgi:outer membrane protein